MSTAPSTALPLPIPAEPAEARRGRAVGALFCTGFGTLWLVLASLADDASRWPRLVLLAACGLALAAVAWRRVRAVPPPPEHTPGPADRARLKAFQRINAAQWVAIPIMAFALGLAGHPEWTTAGVMVIVGLHFLPLARLFAYPPHRLTAAALVALGTVGPILAGAPQAPLLPALAGLVLWLSALGLLHSGAAR